MTPELKKDLDDLFDSTAAAVKELHNYHGAEPGELTITLAEDGDICDDCDCPLADEGFATPIIETLDDVDTWVTGVAEDFARGIHALKEDMEADMVTLAEALEETDLDDTVVGLVIATRMSQTVQELEAAFQ